MANINFIPFNKKFRELMGNGIIYTVPMFQRDYSWTETEWDDLWQDILEIYRESESDHFMSYLVLKSDDNKNYEIIDGQQRIATLSLIVLAVLKNLQELQLQEIDVEKNKIRLEQLRNSYIGYLDPATLISSSKLKLNKHNDYLYQNSIVPLVNLPKKSRNASDQLIIDAFKWFTEKVTRDISIKDGAELARFIGLIADKLFFTVISVTDELNAYKVFETLNARGVRLSTTDLLKNYLFRVISSQGTDEIEINKIEERWEMIISKLSGEKFPDFLRAYWNSRYKIIRKTNLFKTISSTIKDKKNVFDLIRELDDNVDLYTALSNPEDKLWTKDQKQYIEELKTFKISQPYSLLMIAHIKFKEKDFEKLLRACSIASFRYNVICGLNPNIMEIVYNDIVVKIVAGELTKISDIISILKGKIYPEDNIFKEAFVEKELKTTGRNKKIVRYILFAIEKQLSHIHYDSKSEKHTIEHVLPESPKDNWPDFNENRDSSFIYRLGNLTLLLDKPNRKIENKGFNEKREIYKDSEFQMTKNIAENNSSWDISRISSRQKEMAQLAASIWSLP
ncbi:MAG: DUF262 domain-containing protein [Nitrospirae bacterium]|nr:DUF262 domain-containing protein [Nitrospirota bacterium]